MLHHIQQTIEELNSKIKLNEAEIKVNQQLIKEMLQTGNEKSGVYDDLIRKNKKLLSLNNDFSNVQKTLLKFVGKHEGTDVFDVDLSPIEIELKAEQKDLFSSTINGIVPFDELHPYYTDSVFIEKLIDFYEDEEDYEMCDELIQQKENILN